MAWHVINIQNGRKPLSQANDCNKHQQIHHGTDDHIQKCKILDEMIQGRSHQSKKSLIILKRSFFFACKMKGIFFTIFSFAQEFCRRSKAFFATCISRLNGFLQVLV